MNFRTVLVCLLLVALVLSVVTVTGCGKKKEGDKGPGATGPTGAGGAPPPAAPGGMPPGMNADDGPVPGAAGAKPAGGPPGMAGGPPGMGGGPPGAGGGPPGMGGGKPAGGPPGMGGGPPGMGGAPAAGGGNAAALVKEGMTAKKQGDLMAAEDKFRAALQVDPKSEDAHWGLAWVLAQSGKKSEAISEFQSLSGSTNADRKAKAAAALKRLGG